MDKTIKRALAIAASKNLTNSELAELLEISPQRLNNWITRGMPPRHDRLVADKLGVSIDVIHDRRGLSPEEKRPVEITSGSDAERRLLMSYRTAGEPERAALVLIAESLSMRAPSQRNPHPLKAPKARKKNSEP
jgi:lambda repressor-like predicted transcriptional regulator